MPRFAHKLEFGDKTHEVSRTAMRLVGRMKRDWIQFGRRPSGICGAALLVAARMHGFNRTIRDISHVVRICGSTLRNRLDEIQSAPAFSISAEDFLRSAQDSFESVPEADPPAFIRNRVKDLSTSGSGERRSKSSRRRQTDAAGGGSSEDSSAEDSENGAWSDTDDEEARKSEEAVAAAAAEADALLMTEGFRALVDYEGKLFFSSAKACY